VAAPWPPGFTLSADLAPLLAAALAGIGDFSARIAPCRAVCRGVGRRRLSAELELGSDRALLGRQLLGIERFGPSLFVKNRGILLALTGRSVEAQRWLRRAQLANPEDRSLQRYLDALSALRAARAAPAAGGSASEGL
jgi:hypothetical protein